MAKRDYLVEAAKQIRMALDREVNEDYEAAFSYYKNGVDLLLNGVQVDPNKERREAVKRKTTQYLKRAEEIFISHLQDNLGKGSSHLGGYSSLRFRPIRHLSSPVEDLEMCKVVGIIDKVLTVQSLVNKETFVVKSLPKSSWESRDQNTIIPQGVPYMVKLLRYYVSEDAVYLHLEHVQGGRLFSKLHRVRSERAKEHPECLSPAQHRIKLKSSYTSPAISADYQQSGTTARRSGTGMTALAEGEAADECPDADSSPASWDEAQQRLESCGTHSYCEETGCLRNPRLSAPRPPVERPSPSSASSSSTPGRRSHSDTQGKPDLPIQPFIGQALDVASGPPLTTGGFGRTESGADLDVVAWNAADLESNGESPAPCAAGRSVPHTTQTSFGEVNAANAEHLGVVPSSHNGSSSPATLHLPLHSQSQVILSANGSHLGCGLGGELVAGATGMITARLGSVCNGHITEEEGQVKSSVRTADAPGSAVCSNAVDGLTRTSCQCPGGQRWTTHHGGVSLALSGVQYRVGPGEEVEEEGWELLSPGGKDAAAPRTDGTPRAPYPAVTAGAYPQCRRGDMDAFLRSEGDDQGIEVEGWCYLPQYPSRSSGGRERAGWGLPEGEARLLGAQILLALESLHQQGILCRDLNPKNVLLTHNGKVCLTFFGQWSEVQSEISSKAMEQMYCAPEIGGVSKITEACDWWSLGALLFELLTGTPLWQFHPAGVRSHTQLLIPDHLSPAAASLLTELLQFDAGYRLGSGGGGVSDIKCHPFFTGVPWQTLGS